MDDGLLPQYVNNYKIARFMMDHFPHPYTIDDAKDKEFWKKLVSNWKEDLKKLFLIMVSLKMS